MTARTKKSTDHLIFLFYYLVLSSLKWDVGSECESNLWQTENFAYL